MEAAGGPGALPKPGWESGHRARSPDTPGIQRGALGPPPAPPPCPLAPPPPSRTPIGSASPQPGPCERRPLLPRRWGSREAPSLGSVGPRKRFGCGESGKLALSGHKVRHMDAGGARDPVRVIVANHGCLPCTPGFLLLFSFRTYNSSAVDITVSPGQG